LAEDTLTRERVERVMHEIPGLTDARLDDWSIAPLAYLSVLPGRGLYRVGGTATSEPECRLDWSAVAKAIGPPQTSGHREVLAYRSGLLANLSGPLRAPRLYGIEDRPDSATWLWLEDVHDRYGRRWPLEQFAAAAHDLGVFNGQFLTSQSVPTQPWLNPWLRQMWAEQRAEVDATPAYRATLERTLDLPEVRQHFGGPTRGQVLRLLDDQPSFRTLLTQLPETLCHHDAALANLFAVEDPHAARGTVAVDWEKIGPGPIGVEIATLTFGTLRRCEFDAARVGELDACVFGGYLEGLREVGWQGPTEQVRLGYLAAIGLRWTVVAGIVRMLVEGAKAVWTSPGAYVSAEEVVEQRVRLVRFVLKCAHEARTLAQA
jgi:hypothetical protein